MKRALLKSSIVFVPLLFLTINLYAQDIKTYIYEGKEYYVLPDTFHSADVGLFNNGISYIAAFNLPDGRWIQLSGTPGKAPLCTGEIKNGQPHGIWNVYYFISDDVHYLAQQIPFKHGKINGNYFTFHQNGKAKTHYEMKDNSCHGFVTAYTPEGNIEMEGSFRYDIQTGIWKHYKEGRLTLVQSYLNEIPADSIALYIRNDLYLSSRPDTIYIPSAEGVWISYYETGNVKWEKTYERGFVAYVKEYHANGSLKFEGSAAGELMPYVKDTQSRKAGFYNPLLLSNKLKRDGSELYIKKGLWKFYDKDGILINTEYY